MTKIPKDCYQVYIPIDQADEEEHHFLTIDEGLEILRRHL